MHGLKSDADLSFLKGRTLEGICMGAFQLKFEFEPDVLIDVQGAVKLKDTSGNEREFEYAVEAVGSMHWLITQTITSESWKVDGTLALGFENGEVLTLLDKREMYEAYQIHYDDLVVVV